MQLKFWRTAVTVAFALTAAACGSSHHKTASTYKDNPIPPSSSSAPSTPATKDANPAGDIPDGVKYVLHTDSSGAISLRAPEGWAASAIGGAAEFTDKLNSIRIEVVPRATAPTAASAATDEIPAIKAANPAYRAGDIRTVQRTAGQAVLITYGADSGPNPVTGKVIHLSVERYEFWKAGKEAILTLSGPVGADNVDPWKTVTDSVEWR